MGIDDLAAKWGLRGKADGRGGSAAPWIAQAERDHPPQGAFVSVNGVGLHYIDRGAGRPVVFLHGAAMLAQELFCGPAGTALARSFRVLAFDRPGYGHSGRGEGHAGPAAQARLIHGALSRLGVERPILVGHSWSGALVMQYGLEYPDEVAGIVSLAGWSFAAHQASLKLLSLFSQGTVETVMGLPLGTKLVRHIAAKAMAGIFAPNPVPLSYAELPIELMLRPSQLRANADDLSALNQDILAAQRRYHGFSVPLEILVGSEDGIVEPARHGRRLAEIIPSSRLTEFANTGHMLHHAHPEALVAAVSRFGP